MDLLVKVKKITDPILETLSGNNISIQDVFHSFNIIHVKASTLQSLKMFEFVEHIEENESYELQELRIIPNIRVKKLKKNNFLGDINSTVAVIDSGMNPVSGVEITDNVICSGSSTSNDAMIKGAAHGTVVGAIIKEIAPWSKLVNIKIADDFKDIKKSAVIKALEHVYTSGIKIVNMSIGKKTDNGSCPTNCLVCNTVNQMRLEGFIIVAAIGNHGLLGEGVTGCPGNAEKALSVGAVDVNKKLASFSSTAPIGTMKPDILAPGYCNLNGLDYSGTSFAAPIITGVLAACAGRFDLEFIVESILKTAQSINLSHNQQGFGLLNIEGLLEVLNNEGNISQSSK